MRILDIGSMNLDYVYQLDHIAQPGETEATGAVSSIPFREEVMESLK